MRFPHRHRGARRFSEPLRGHDQALTARLIAAARVTNPARRAGYGGPLCGNGSTEYVAFWIDFNDGNGFQYMGTATVNVHDLQTIPNEDVQYAVFLRPP
jgi:hypothetical protein